jgi:hypothetical protein
MLRARRAGNGQVLFTVSGRIETGDIKELQEFRRYCCAASWHSARSGKERWQFRGVTF